MKVANKLALTTVLMSISVGLLLGFVVFDRVSNLTQEHIIHSQITNAKHVMHNINQALLKASRDIQMLAEDEFLQQYVTSPSSEHEKHALLEEELEERMELTGPWDALMVLDHDGNHIISAGEHSGHGAISKTPDSLIAFKASMEGSLYISDWVISDHTGLPTLIYAIPIMGEEEEKLVGSMIAHYRLSSIQEILEELPAHTNAHLFDSSATVFIVSKHEEDQFTHDAFSSLPLVQQALAGESFGSSIDAAVHGDHESLNVMVTQDNHHGFRSKGWGLLLELPINVLIKPVTLLALQTSLLILMVLLLLASLLTYLANKIMRPLSQLTEYTKQVGKGEFTHSLDIKSSDEIGTLATSFNQMSGQLKKRSAELIDSDNRYSRVVNSISDIIYKCTPPSYDPSYINQAVENLLGFTPDEFLTTPGIWKRQILEQDWEQTLTKINTAYEDGVDFNLEYRMLHKDGKRILWFEDRCSWEKDSEGNIIALFGVMTDITERKTREEKLRRNSRALSAIHTVDTLMTRATDEETLMQGVCDTIVNQAGYCFAWIGLIEDGQEHDIHPRAYAGENKHFIEELKRGPVNLENNQATNTVLQTQHPFIATYIDQHKGLSSDLKLARKYGFSSLIILPLSYENNISGVLAIYSDENDVFDHDEIKLLTELSNNLAYGIAALRTQILHRHAEEKISHQAFHDSLTRLPNRLLFRESLQEAISRCERHGGTFAIFFIDLDDFKLVNDILGHEAGDQLLCKVGTRLREVIRDTDIVARQGGDEFIVLLNGPQPGEGSRRHTDTGFTEELNPSTLAQRIIDTLSRPFSIVGQDTYVGASIGISIYPDDAIDAKTLLSYADSAMYRIKELGKGGYQFYSHELTQRQQKRMLLANKLHLALKEKEFVLHYQPIIDLNTGGIVGVEALIRWQPGTGELIPPSDFLPIAEDTGLIIPIGDWVLEEACRQAQEWQARNIDIYIAINLSARQFWKDDIATKILDTVNKSGIPHSAIELEITESAMSLDQVRLESAMQCFNRGGMKISLDDFGTGYSSLSRLKHLPIKTLKVDKSFVDGIPLDGDDVAIVTATVQLANSLGISSLAEGIETATQWEWLRNNGCQYGQGYYFSRPVPPSEIENIIKQKRQWKPDLQD